MAQIKDIFKFRKSYLAMTIGFSLLPSAHAMQELSDSSLSDTTGEGVALVLDDFKMVFQGPKDLSSGSSYARGIENPGQADTGFIRIIPTGENYEKLGENVYDKIYKTSYDNNVLQGKIDSGYNILYTSTYNSTYDTSYTSLYSTYTQPIPDKLTAERTKLESEIPDRYFNSDAIIQRYFNERHNYYRNGTNRGLFDPDGRAVNDGTTVYTTRPVSEDPTGLLNYAEKALEHATTNTYEMIQLLYGGRASEANANLANSTFYKSLTGFTRNNVIGSEINSLVQRLSDASYAAADIRAKFQAGQIAEAEAKKQTEELYAGILSDAKTDALLEAKNTTVGSLRTKADVFIYGLALSKSDGSLSTRYSNQGFSWGSAENPWLFRAGTENVKQFKDAAKDVGYIALEAPLSPIAGVESDNNIKLGFWSDIFARELNSSNVVDPITGGPTSGLDKEHRLRTQFVANGLSLNGSQIRLFQTLESDNKDYNQTLGLASIIRLNTDDNPSATGYLDTRLLSRLDKVKNKTDAEIAVLRTLTDKQLEAEGFDREMISAESVTLARTYAGNTDSINTRNNALNRKGIRLSTAAKTEGLDGDGPTPALNGSIAPVFHDFEGLYLYSPNINLVLGNMYQPFVVGSEGNNIILEVTRIPNIASIYNQIYQNYGGGLGTTDLKGSTCNVYSCGTPIKNNSSDTTALYQGRNATHSSISIGTTERISGTNLLRAKDGVNSTGVVFKSVDGSSKNFGSAVIDGVLIQHLKIKTTGL
ncbi:hypothetical protein [Acinetobacter lwoffii]|uniref:hypothetical protein n=1 Tax=Acinetobacter lwoffii TaxID=28090 RepID=UPI00209AC076|nr:hypothetical protein [Acinetobacter lwoffii]MCO8093103.1 hypothetical protein [Acinetobacter lwoffii]